MENHDSPEAIAKRASQEDPIVMYLIVREELNMSIGKTAAQCAHASQMLQLKYDSYILGKQLNVEGTCSVSQLDLDIFDNWLASSFRKVVLKADNKEFIKIKKLNYEKIIVVDSGLTELEPNTETVIGLFPMKKSVVPKLIKRLQALK